MSTEQYFAQINDDNIVTTVAVTTAEFIAENPDRYPGRWVETFIGVPDKTYAGIGYIYDETTDNFNRPPSPPLPTPIEDK
jgi:hypothetical protein